MNLNPIVLLQQFLLLGIFQEPSEVDMVLSRFASSRTFQICRVVVYLVADIGQQAVSTCAMLALEQPVLIFRLLADLAFNHIV